MSPLCEKLKNCDVMIHKPHVIHYARHLVNNNNHILCFVIDGQESIIQIDWQCLLLISFPDCKRIYAPPNITMDSLISMYHSRDESMVNCDGFEMKNLLHC